MSLPDMPEPFLSQQAVINWVSCQPQWCEQNRGRGFRGFFEVPTMENLRLSREGWQEFGAYWHFDSIRSPIALTGSQLITLGRILKSPWYLASSYRSVQLYTFSRRAHMEWALMENDLAKWIEFRKPVDNP